MARPSKMPKVVRKCSRCRQRGKHYQRANVRGVVVTRRPCVSCCAESQRGDLTRIIWKGLRNRCNNPNYHGYHLYGGRGIKVCAQWADPHTGFAVFVEDMGRRPSEDHSIDRIDNNGDYEPGNCRWATRSQQQRNKRNSAYLTVGDETKLLQVWAEVLGVTPATIRYRLKKGWTTEDAVLIPRHQGPNKTGGERLRLGRYLTVVPER